MQKELFRSEHLLNCLYAVDGGFLLYFFFLQLTLHFLYRFFVANKPFELQKQHIFPLRTVVPIQYSFRDVILFEINNIAFAKFALNTSISHIFPPIRRLFAHCVNPQD